MTARARASRNTQTLTPSSSGDTTTKTYVDTADALKAPLASPAFTGTPTGITKTHVGLSNVDNTSNATERAAARILTNARITKRVGSTTSSATPTINTDSYDMYGLTAQAADITSFTTNLSGTPTDGQLLWIYIVGTATRVITWGASFEDGSATLPPATIGTNRMDVTFVWNAATSKWRCMGTSYAARPAAKRVVAVTLSATPAINTDLTDAAQILSMTTAITSLTTNLTGTPRSEDTLMIMFTSASALAIAHGSSFQSGSAQLLSATVAGKTHREYLVWDTTVSKWVCVASNPTGY